MRGLPGVLLASVASGVAGSFPTGVCGWGYCFAQLLLWVYKSNSDSCSSAISTRICSTISPALHQGLLLAVLCTLGHATPTVYTPPLIFHSLV